MWIYISTYIPCVLCILNSSCYIITYLCTLRNVGCLRRCKFAVSDRTQYHRSEKKTPWGLHCVTVKLFHITIQCNNKMTVMSSRNMAWNFHYRPMTLALQFTRVLSCNLDISVTTVGNITINPTGKQHRDFPLVLYWNGIALKAAVCIAVNKC